MAAGPAAVRGWPWSRWRVAWAAGLGPLERSAVEEESRWKAIERLRPTALVLCAVHLAHVLAFGLWSPGPAESAAGPRWRREVLVANALFVLIAASLAVLLRQRRGGEGARSRALLRIPPVAALLYLLLAVFLASVDQRVTTAITPYVGGAIGIAVLIRLEPPVAVSFQALGFALFAAGQIAMQPALSARLSNLSNGFSMACLSAVMGYALASVERREIHQRRVITRQTRDLSDMLGEVRRLARTAEAGSRAKGAFLANMSHEIRTPMNAMLGLASLTRSEVQSERHREWLATIERSGRALLTLLEDVLAMARLDAGKLVLSPAPCDLGALVREVVAAFEATIRAKRLAVEVEEQPQPLPPLLVDEVQLRQVLFNLVGNALKFTDRGEVTIRVAIARQPGSERRASLTVEVVDTGIGIAADDHQRVFEPFVQASASGPGRGGSGLGLSITRRLVEAMGGTVEVESALGAGSTFRVRLPDRELRPVSQPVTPISRGPGATRRSQPTEAAPGEGGAPVRSLPAAKVSAALAELRGPLAPLRDECGRELRSDRLSELARGLSSCGRRLELDELQAVGDRLDRAVALFDVEEMKAAIVALDGLSASLEASAEAVG